MTSVLGEFAFERGKLELRGYFCYLDEALATVGTGSTHQRIVDGAPGVPSRRVVERCGWRQSICGVTDTGAEVLRYHID